MTSWPCSAPASRAVPVLESFDQAGLLVRLMPEWNAVRFAAQHNPVHRCTVDLQLPEMAAQAAEWSVGVARPDLLLIGSLLHDIGKGYPRADHSSCRRGHGREDRQPDGAVVRHAAGASPSLAAKYGHRRIWPIR